MSTASRGRAYEHRVRDSMIAHGWQFIMRSAGSRGPADIAMAHPLFGLALVQVGTANKTLGPADRDRLCTAAELCGALSLIAIVTPHQPITYHQVTRDKPSLWTEWTH